MHIIVLGAGVIGTTQAYYLAKKGFKVTVIDRHEGVALDASYANAGQISPGYATPWAAPGIPLKALKWLVQKHAPLAIRPTLSLFQYQWMMQMVLNCTKARYSLNKSRLVRLSEYSRDCMIGLRQATGLHYEERMLGTTQLLRTQKQMAAINNDIEVLEAFNVPYEVLDPEGIIKVEPGLKNSAHKLVGALRLPHDETGDCYLFTNKIRALAEALGVTFEYNTTVTAIKQQNHKISGIMVGDTLRTADQYVVCLGSYGNHLLAPLGIHIPVYPLKGYSLTVPITNAAGAPTSTILDETYKIAITRFDKRIRVGGMAEISGYNLKLDPRRRATLEFVTNDLYPDGGDTTKGEFWTGLRPKTPDSTPIIGRTSFDNLFLNIGHGTLGWTQAAGSGCYLSDLISGTPTEISGEGLDIARYQK